MLYKIISAAVQMSCLPYVALNKRIMQMCSDICGLVSNTYLRYRNNFFGTTQTVAQEILFHKEFLGI